VTVSILVFQGFSFLMASIVSPVKVFDNHQFFEDADTNLPVIVYYTLHAA
jgi:hypothetical protein